MSNHPHVYSYPMWSRLWLGVRGLYGDKVRRWQPNPPSGYHAMRSELEADDYSVMRQVDQLGQDYVSAMGWYFPDARRGYITDVQTVTSRLLSAYDNPKDGRIGPHNTAEIYGTLDGRTVVGRLHGRYASQDQTFLQVVHIALNRRWAANDYVCRSVLSVIEDEPHHAWWMREHGSNR